MQIRVGYELIYSCPQETPMILIVNIHYSRASDIVIPDYLTTAPSVPITAYRDPFGNWCNRIVAPAGQMRLTSQRGVKRLRPARRGGALRSTACGGGFAGRDARLPAREPLL